jgi:phospho-N-acetylmuramoyl-pentapeptide-transferase
MMLYQLLYPLHTTYSGFNVFRYITFRTAMALATALILSLCLGPWMIRQLRARQIGETIRSDGPEGHRAKAGTPTVRTAKFPKSRVIGKYTCCFRNVWSAV